MSLRTSDKIITFIQIINNVSGVYSILVLLMGAHLSGLQLSRRSHPDLEEVPTGNPYWQHLFG
jgi:hypothetical protein